MHPAHRPLPTVGDLLRTLLMIAAEWPLLLLCRRFTTFVWAMRRLTPHYMEWSGRVKARNAFLRAARRVPAYRAFVARHASAAEPVPETDKERYIKPYGIAERCVGGRIPARQTVIDESSGSTGTPYNWIRSPQERATSHQQISFFARYCFGAEPRITLNAFSMGAWATGLNMGLSMQQLSIVKNTGPDIGKLLHTLRVFGPGYRYLITGYPPFLKHLIDVAEAEGFPLQDYRLDALVGGEGMSEGLRDYLLRRFESVYSGFGATDLEIGLAGETPVAVAVRRLARTDPAVRQALFGSDSRLPMVFQYNPLMHFIEVNARRELLFTITRGNLLSPRIRYNVHDEGGVARYDELARRLAEVGTDLEALVPPGSAPRLRFPFAWVYGRSDYTISVMGANIYPEDLEQAVYADAELARVAHSFCLSLAEPAPGEVRPCFLFEISVEPSEELRARFAASIATHLRAVNADYREACKEFPEALVPVVELYRQGEGPFAADATKIKQSRLIAKR